MKINLTANDLARLQHLIDIKETNIQVADMYLYYLLEQPLSITKKIRDTKYAHIKDDITAFYVALMDILAIDVTLDDNQSLAKTYFLEGITKLDPTPFIDNPYYQLIRPLLKKQGQWSFRFHTYQPYQGFAYDDIEVDPIDFRERSPMGFFTSSYDYLTIYENQKLWMSLIPHEIKTMVGPLSRMRGHVLVGGLGLGYFTYMASLSNEVTRITVIEKNTEVIALFNKELLPKFCHKYKIEIIEDDVIDYLRTTNAIYDSAFIDIWLGANDGLLPYLKIKRLEQRAMNTTFTYWIEPSLLAYFRRLLLVLIEETLEGYPAESYRKAKTDEDRIINALYAYFIDQTFTRYEDMHALLTDDALRLLAKSIDI